MRDGACASAAAAAAVGACIVRCRALTPDAPHATRSKLARATSDPSPEPVDALDAHALAVLVVQPAIPREKLEALRHCVAQHVGRC